MKVGIAVDHGGFNIKDQIRVQLELAGYSVTDFGAVTYDKGDDYPDYIIPLAKAVALGYIERGIAICGSGVGASIAANKVRGARAALIHDVYSARQGVEDDNMNVICLGGRVTAISHGWELILAFLNAKFSGLERHNRRLEKVNKLEEYFKN